MRPWRALALAGVLAGGGCGLKNDPVPPEMVRPTPPAKVAATATADGVELRWRRPTAYTGGGRMRDLRGFDVERAATADGPFATVGTTTLEDQQRFRQERAMSWIDRGAERGRTYAYRVIAFTVDGSRSDPSPPVEIRYVPPRERPADAAE